jgi:hypothetical protein
LKRRYTSTLHGVISRKLSSSTGLLFILPIIYEHEEPRWNDIDRGKRRTRIKTWPSVTLSNRNPALIEPSANPGLRSERTHTNHLSHGAARFNLAPIRTYSFVKISCFHSPPTKFRRFYPP